tara:strand:- start:914 stop:1306 length:393 start_codon:yes stop_codon:yes gene_type:complete
MEPKIWGPHAWIFLHTITLNYPENPNQIEKQNYKSFFESLSKILPCDNCREHYSENIENIPIDLQSRESLVQWLFTIHNKVNQKNNKQLVNYDDFINKYSELYNQKDKNYILYTILLLIAIILFIIYKKK